MLKYIWRSKAAEYTAGHTVFILTVQNDFKNTKEF